MELITARFSLVDRFTRQPGHFETVLVAAAGEADDDHVRTGALGRDPHRFHQRMGGLQCRQYAFQPRTGAEHVERVAVTDAAITDTSAVAPEAVFRPDSRIIQPGRDRMNRRRLTVVVLQHVTEASV